MSGREAHSSERTNHKSVNSSNGQLKKSWLHLLCHTCMSSCEVARIIHPGRHSLVVLSLVIAGVPSFGEAVQVDPMQLNLKPPGTVRLKLQCDDPLSNSGFKFNLRRYSSGGAGRTSRWRRRWQCWWWCRGGTCPCGGSTRRG